MKNVNSSAYEAHKLNHDKKAKMRLAGDLHPSFWGLIVQNWQWIAVACFLAFIAIFLMW
jgi:hypothetical protein